LPLWTQYLPLWIWSWNRILSPYKERAMPSWGTSAATRDNFFFEKLLIPLDSVPLIYILAQKHRPLWSLEGNSPAFPHIFAIMNLCKGNFTLIEVEGRSFPPFFAIITRKGVSPLSRLKDGLFLHFCHYEPKAKGSFTLIQVEGRSFPPFLPSFLPYNPRPKGVPPLSRLKEGLFPHFCHHFCLITQGQREFHPYPGWRKVFSPIFATINARKGSFTLIPEGRSFPTFCHHERKKREFHPVSWLEGLFQHFAIMNTPSILQVDKGQVLGLVRGMRDGLFPSY